MFLQIEASAKRDSALFNLIAGPSCRSKEEAKKSVISDDDNNNVQHAATILIIDRGCENVEKYCHYQSVDYSLKERTNLSSMINIHDLNNYS